MRPPRFLLAAAAALPLMPVGTIGVPAGTGPYPAVAASVESLRTHTLYYPARMPSSPMPLVVWGEGACADNGLIYAGFLREIASHGYVVIALGHAREEDLGLSQTPGAIDSSGPLPFPRYGETKTADFGSAIDWATTESQRKGGMFRGHIDLTRVAVMGHSCGGVQAIAASADARVKTSLFLNSGLIADGPQATGEMNVPKSALNRLHAPVLYVAGGQSDIAFGNTRDDVARIDHVGVVLAYDDTGHYGTYWAPNGGEYAQISVAWLDWRLKGNAAASRTFLGADCRLCTDARWTIERKNLD